MSTEGGTVPDFLATDIMEQGMKLQELYNEICSLEDQKSEIGCEKR